MPPKKIAKSSAAVVDEKKAPTLAKPLRPLPPRPVAEEPKPKAVSKATPKAKVSPKKVVQAATPTEEDADEEPEKPKKTRKSKTVVVEEDDPVEDDDVEDEAEGDADDEDDEGDKPRAKGARRRPTAEEYVATSKQLLELCDAEINRRARKKEPGIRSFRKMRKLIARMQKDFPHVIKARRPRDPTKTNVTPSGFAVQHMISAELAKFLKVPSDTRLSRLEATRAICAYVRLKEGEDRETILRWANLNPGGKRDLQDPNDKRAIIPDALLSKLLRFPDYQKKVANGMVTKKTKNKETGQPMIVKVDNDKLYYVTLQQLLSQHLIKE